MFMRCDGDILWWMFSHHRMWQQRVRGKYLKEAVIIPLYPFSPDFPWFPGVPGKPSSPAFPLSPFSPLGPPGPLSPCQYYLSCIKFVFHFCRLGKKDSIIAKYLANLITPFSSVPFFSFVTLIAFIAPWACWSRWSFRPRVSLNSGNKYLFFLFLLFCFLSKNFLRNIFAMLFLLERLIQKI